MKNKRTAATSEIAGEKGHKKIQGAFIIALCAVIASVLLLTVVLVALFSHTTEFPFDDDSDTGVLSVGFSTVTVSGLDVFNEKGDKLSINLPIENKGNVNFKYSIGLKLVLPQREADVFGLENATLVYFDDKFIGILSSLVDEYGKVRIDAPTPLIAGEIYTHKLTLEYHIGANSYFDSKPSSFYELIVTADAVQVVADTDKYLFADNIYELSQIINYYPGDGYTVQLTNDVALEESLIINRPLSINLAGYELALNGFSLNYTYSSAEISRLYSSRAAGTVKKDGGEIIVNTANSYVINEIAGFAVSITNAGIGKLVSDYDSFIRETISGGIVYNTDLYGFFGEYISRFGFTFSADGSPFTGNIAFTEPAYSTLAHLRLKISDTDERQYEIKIWGADAEDAADNIIANNFFFLTENAAVNKDGVDYTVILSSINLPTIDKTTNAKILWISGNRTVLNESGEYFKPYRDTYTELSAIISVNGKNILRTFPVLAKAKTPEEKLREIILIYGSMYFTQLNTVLPIPVMDYFIENFGMDLLSFSFSLPSAISNVFDLDTVNNTLELILATDIKSSYLEITADFENGTAVGRIQISIELVTNISYWDSAYKHILTYLADVPEKTLEGFGLPDNYKSVVSIKYHVIPDKVGDSEFYNPSDVGDYVKVKGDGTGVELIFRNLPQDNEVVTIMAEITYDGITEMRYFSFSISGVIFFEDINLLQEIRKTYLRGAGLGRYGMDWVFTRDEVDNFPSDSLVANYHYIVSLVGLEYFTKLTYLDLSNNYITDLTPISGLTNLTTLRVGNNRIVSVDDLQNLNNLHTLDLSNNFITSIIALSNNVSLQGLAISGNALLSDISALTGLTSLYYLDVNSTDVAGASYMANLNTILTIYQTAVSKGNTPTIYVGSYFQPSAINLSANTIVNQINPIYEFYNVIYLPPQIRYGGVNYDITWNTNRPDIIKFNGDRAYVVLPVADINVRISAAITYSGFTIARYINVLSRSDHHSLSINGTVIDAMTAIPDETLRYNLFKHFDVNADNNITDAEIASKVNNQLDLSGTGIRNLKGIGLFAAGIVELVLKDNEIEDFSELGLLTNLLSLSINGKNNGIDFLYNLKKLIQLSVYGLKNVNSNENLAILYDLYKNNRGVGIRIFKDSANDVWNPYIEPMEKALKNLEGIHLLYPGADPIVLQNYLGVTMYKADDIIYCGVSYNKVNTPQYNPLTSYQYTLSGYSLSLSWPNMLSEDNYGILSASIYIEGTGATRYLQAVSLYASDLYVEIGGGVFEPLITAVPNNMARQAFISKIPTSGPYTTSYQGKTIKYVRRADYLTITSIDFNGMALHGVRGLELLRDSVTLNTFRIEDYIPRSGDAGSIAWEEFEKANYLGLQEVFSGGGFTALRELSIRCAVLDMYELTKIAPQITKLTIYDSAKVVMDSVNASSERESVFDYFTSLTSLTLTKCNIRDFWAITKLTRCTSLAIYNNDVSTTALTDYYVTQVYKNLAFGTKVYYYLLNNYTLWIPPELDLDVASVTYVDTGYSAHEGLVRTNYVIAGREIKVPLKYKSATTNMRWSFHLGSLALPIVSTAPDGSYQIMRFSYPSGMPQISAYIILKGEMFDPDNPTTVYFSFNYVFVMKSQNSDSAYLDLNDFMTNGIFADNNFVYYLLSNTSMPEMTGGATGLTEDTGSGMFRMSNVRAVWQINQGLTSVSVNASIVFVSIKGIKNFTGVTYIYLGNHKISDISELYYLTSLQTLSMGNNSITSLRISDGTSIFYNMPGLYGVQIYVNPLINDFLPIIERRPDIKTAALRMLSHIDIMREWGTNNFPFWYNDDAHIYDMVNQWWAVKGNVRDTYSPSLRIVGDSTMNSWSDIDNYFYYLEVLKTFHASNNNKVVTTGTVLPIVATYNSINYGIAWAEYRTQALTISGSGAITAISSMYLHVNTDIIMRVYIPSAGQVSGIAIPITVKLSVNDARNIDDFRVEILDSEWTVYKALYGLSDSDRTSAGRTDRFINPQGVNLTALEAVYYIKADKLIPKSNMRLYMFYNFDSNRDNTLSMSERRAPADSVSFGSTVIDIRGAELLYNVVEYYFYSMDYVKFPNLPIRTGVHRLVNLLYFFPYKLINVSEGFSFDADGSGTNYTSLSKIIENLAISDGVKLPDSEYAWIASNMPKLQTLGGFNTCVTDYDVLYPFIKNLDLHTVSLIDGNKVPAYANNNPNKYRRLVLDSYTTRQFSLKDAPLLNVIKDLLTLSELMTGVNSLIKTFQIPGFDRVYRIIWTPHENFASYYNIYEENGVFKINVLPGAPEIISVYASVEFYDEEIGAYRRTTYKEKIDLVVINNEFDLSKMYFNLSGWIWSEGIQDYVWAENAIPDAILRYYFFKKFDFNNDKTVTRQELSQWQVVLSDELMLSSLEGIQLLFYTTNLQVNFVYTYDLNPISSLTQIERLTLNMAYMIVTDVSFLEPLRKLWYFDGSNTGFLNYNFLMNNEDISSLANINYSVAWYGASGGHFTLYAKNAWAYTRLYNDLPDTYPTPNTQDEKWAAIYLGLLEMDMKDNAYTSTGKDFSEVNTTVNEAGEVIVELPSLLTYIDLTFSVLRAAGDGHTGTLSYRSLCRNVEILGDAENGFYALIHEDPLSPVQCYTFVARITYNGGTYEKLFTVRYPS